MANTGIPDNLVNKLSQITLADSAAVDAFFLQQKNQRYIPWFNATLAGKGAWAKVKLVDTPQNDLLFHQFWNQIDHIFGADCTLTQFISLMSIVSNEQSGNFFPITEKMGIAGHPGMAYLFDRIGAKRSYNTLAGNKTALACFNDNDYINAHGALPLATLARTNDARWGGETWPAGITTDPTAAGFVTQADFMKFRGRGVIQTTGRTNYMAIIDFVQSYQGENNAIDFFQSRWQGMSRDLIATITTNADWDRLFQQTDLIIATEGVRLHSHNSGNYLALSEDPAILNGQGPGSVYYMGLRISGGAAYAATFKQRVVEVLNAI